MEELVQSTEKDQKSRNKRPFRALIMLALLFVIATSLLVAKLTLNRPQTTLNPNALPAALLAQIQNFTPYYFSGNTPPAALHLKAGTATYSNGILLFSLQTPKNEQITITEQAVPKDFAKARLQGDETFTTASGRATVSSVIGGRTTASLITDSQTLVLLNTADHVELSIIKDVLHSLQAVK